MKDMRCASFKIKSDDIYYYIAKLHFSPLATSY